MRAHSIGAAVVGVCLLLWLLAVPALAHGGRPPVQGIVISVSSGSLQVETSGGSMTFGLTGGTRVIRQAAGSEADLTPNSHVAVHFARGSRTVDAVWIDLAGAWQHTESSQSHPASKPLNNKPKGKIVTHSGGPHHPVTGDSGQLISATSRSITLRGRSGQTSTYALTSNPTITTLMPGQISDLAMGETVQVLIGRGNVAAVITIINA